MKIFDCTIYHNEDLMMEVRLNILKNYVDKFVICESKYTHSGRKKKLNFDIKKFSSFKNKIIYLVDKEGPQNLVFDKDDIEEKKNMRHNSIKRVAFQRNFLSNGLSEAGANDLVLYSDNDEIPELKNIKDLILKSKILIFNQKLFYYKFNLLCDRIPWFGTRACLKKNLPSFEILRLIKPKKYPIYRIDTLFKKNKYMDIQIIKNAGWHFTRVISPTEIHERELDTEHHDEYRLSKKNPKKIEDLIKRKVIDHDHLADQSEFKYANEFKLKRFSLESLPEYISNNIEKYKNFIDID